MKKAAHDSFRSTPITSSQKSGSRVINSIFAFLILSTGAMTQAHAVQINGAGATFPYPIYSKWISEFQKIEPNAQINYQSIGSGGGARQFLQGTIDFGASDSPLTDEQLKKATIPILYVPTVLGAVALTYNLPEVKGEMKFSSEVIADIFMGKLKKWNDPRIVALNPGMTLPDQAILVAYRSDGSGTTGIFTDYLSKVSPEWKTKVGSGPAVRFPTGIGGKGNEGVTGLVKQTPGSLGYVEMIYAKNNGLPLVSIKNQAGTFVQPSAKSVTDAAAGAMKNMPENFLVSITQSEGKGAYPISGFTYLLIHPTMPKDKGPLIQKFLKWALGDGQKFAEPLHYAPLPKDMAKKALAKVNEIKVQ